MAERSGRFSGAYVVDCRSGHHVCLAATGAKVSASYRSRPPMVAPLGRQRAAERAYKASRWTTA